MKELAGLLAALDPDASAAVRVIAYFDRLVEAHAGLEPIVRGAAILAGCPARLVDDEHRIRIRVRQDGVRADDPDAGDPDWLHDTIFGGDRPAGSVSALWLERSGPAGPVEAMVLERATAAARGALERTRGRAAATDDAAFVEIVLDSTAAESTRLHAARRLGLQQSAPARAIAYPGGAAGVQSMRPMPRGHSEPGDPLRDPTRRAGRGPAVAVLDLPSSWTGARTALRFTADGTEGDPGPLVVDFETLGGLAVLASCVSPESAPVPDVQALNTVAATAPWVLATLDAIAGAPSLRAAAAALTLHHSTLQDRLAHAEHLLGWSVHDPQGRLRLQLALVLRRLHRSAR